MSARGVVGIGPGGIIGGMDAAVAFPAVIIGPIGGAIGAEKEAIALAGLGGAIGAEKEAIIPVAGRSMAKSAGPLHCISF